MHKIMIVDDESLFKEGFIRMADWETLGFKIIGEASNGVEALELIKVEKPDIVITDIKMPIMDGIELTRQIKQKYSEIQVVALSSFDEFDYVKGSLKSGAVDYILKAKTDKTELISVLTKIRASVLPERIKDIDKNEKITHLLNSIINSTLNAENAYRQIKDLNISLAPNNLFMAVVRSEESSIHSKELLKFLQNDLNMELGKLSGNTSYSISYKGNIHILNTNCPVGKLPDVHRYLSEAIENINQKFHKDAYIIVSDIFCGYEKINSVLNELLIRANIAFYKEDEHFIVARNVKKAIPDFEIDMKDTHTMIERLEFNKLPDLLRSCVQKKVDESILIDPYALKRTLCEIYYQVLNRISEMGYDEEELAKKKTTVLKRIDSAKTFKEAFDVYGVILDEIESRLKQSGKYIYSESIGKIVEYIHENYSEDISLARIATKFHLNKSYLCNLFKQQTGKNYNDYITEIRISKAQKLLKGTDMQISEICGLIGISNQSYFTKVFKKYTGMTPTEYFKLHRKLKHV